MIHSTLLGILAAVLSVFVAILIEGASLRSFFHLPAMLLIVGGTLGATFASYSISQVTKAVRDTRFALSRKKERDLKLIFFRFWEKARKDGLLSLEDEAKKLENPFLQKGIQLIVDGSDPRTIEEILWEAHEEEEKNGLKSAKVFETAAGFSPTVGIIGTVLGLVTVLENLDGGTKVLGQGIATAFIATFYGISFANLILLPISNQLKVVAKRESNERQAIMRGILSLQSGENRRILAERIDPFVKY
ncbi:motility protein A [Leptospira bandrabouensis]|uniref:Endoflagellar motor protein n=1 Tax=Leptospira bandrabouensis TaxID=2484903 RepID=A0A6H3NRW8_9LEPT|nr:MotA/TolQ/ExbB proton channel family protein [Leptospira bandrabouensis]MCG6144594.1 MotA/TolQ/ExbB proton channel family protein [Leptospira bandrabouensis]MCG6150398.1 MotA/TolQ/ExbB proton channel family protein [Leptospira bandrabouensis]MCG6160255.1 MotA/TolQ/ExbB proton channel family protein [Leptospira bandrabouensis]MCG6164188.1 MotA/TolQ/ExbB proton channel family protein [Leptospira bandrabouensis]TGN05750.1 endoflagellar motor protein [Leptospira bandrabouensis]